MEHRYPPLQPAPAAAEGNKVKWMGMAGPKRKRAAVSIACNECRRRKVRCNGQRPTCANCQDQISRCEYRNEDGMSAETREVVVEMVGILNQLSTPQLGPTLQALASESDAAVILSALRNAVRSNTQSDAQVSTEWNLERNTATLDHEEDQPSTFSDPAASNWSLFQEQPYRGLTQPSRERHLRSRDAKPNHPVDGTPNIPSATRTIRASQKQVEHNDRAYLCDPRLKELKIRHWTNVDINDELAASCISLYLVTDHPLLGHFDPELFVSDLVLHKEEFCSPLLVNALLYWASQMYSIFEPHTDSLSHLLCEEAEFHWNKQIQDGNELMTTISAAVFLSLGYLGQGRDHSVLKYLTQATKMGERMGLFGVEHDEVAEERIKSAERIGRMTDAQSMRSHVAWGVFNWATLMSLFYHQPGINFPTVAPRDAKPEGFGSESFASRYMGRTFQPLCQFWEILHEVTLRYHADGSLPWGSKSSLSFAEFKFREILAWRNALEPDLIPSNNGPHHVHIMHIWYHAAVIDIFRPFCGHSVEKNKRLRTFTFDGYTPQFVTTSFTTKLKSLVVTYRLNHASSSFTILWHTALIYVANAILEGDHTGDWYSYILFCLYGYERLSKSWRVARVITRGLLSLALQKGYITSDVARRILQDVERYGQDEDLTDLRATFMVDLDRSLSSPDAATVEQLAHSFEDHASISDYTTLFEDQ